MVRVIHAEKHARDSQPFNMCTWRHRRRQSDRYALIPVASSGHASMKFYLK